MNEKTSSPQQMLEWLPAKTASVICIIISICAKITLAYILFTFEGDKLLQTMAARNLADGHGLTLAQVHSTDLSKLAFEPLNGWPPGYSLLAGIFYSILNKNLLAASFGVNVLFFVAFVLLLYRLLVFLDFPSWLINIIILFNGFTISKSLNSPTDLPAMFFCLWSCYMMALFEKNKNQSAIFGLKIGIVNGCATLLRYMYIGVCPVIPVLLIWNGWYKRDRRILAGGFYSMAGTLVVTGSMLLFQHIYTGNYVYARPSTQGLFFSNLLTAYPFVIASFLNLDFYLLQIEKISGFSYIHLLLVTKVAGAATLFILLYVLIKHSIKTRLIGKTHTSIFFMTGGWISFCIVVILSYLSIRNSAYYVLLPGFKWVYISEGRYFAVAQVFILLFAGWRLFLRPANDFKKTRLFFQCLFFLLSGIEIIHGSYFIGKHLVKKSPAFPSSTYIYDKTKTLIALMDSAAKNKQAGLVFASNKESLCARASFQGTSVLYNVAEINSPVIHSTSPILLFVCLYGDNTSNFKFFLQRPEVTKVYQESGYNFYTYYIEAGGNK